MRCPFCSSGDSRVIESRLLEGETSLRRRRECMICNRRFTTYERVETIPLMVLKQDGTRQAFDPNKVINGLVRACVKCSVSSEEMTGIAREVEGEIAKRFHREITSREIGDLVLERLKTINEVAYIRFASVYRQFASIEDFILFLKDLPMKQMKPTKPSNTTPEKEES